MSHDPFDALRTELVRAADRRRSLLLPGRRRAVALGLSLVALGGTATAAVVTGGAEQSAPLAARLPASKSDRGYAISVAPDLRAGAVGWCTTTRFTSSGRFTGFGSGCGGAAAAGYPAVSGASAQLGRGVLFTAIVTPRVAVVAFPGAGRVAPRPDPRLPYGWRAAVLYVPGGRVDPQSFGPATFERADGTRIPSAFAPERFTQGAHSRRLGAASRAGGCAIGAAAGFRAVEARVAGDEPRVPKLEDPAFFSCARTVFRLRDGDTRLDAAILLDAEDPDAPAAPLAPSFELAGRRIGPAWLVVSGGSAVQRARLLAALRPRL